ncbi:hypothetical protein [Pseudalkalibacillus hwajinpoensis]|uniref:hypothetical protein n=1 Tax=Guptibacillus hwajinpoensis TaxID=208199 RepID=UPI001CD32E1B|nr:hypothetical protein [Pseudalkalibacillus hwajinpoensis]MCA0990017.1 hypothetical protein [Pseudalkalibacillus hwajinpoensis]
MNKLYWMDKEICNLDIIDLETLKILLPYWGITFQNNRLIGSLITKKMYLNIESSDRASFFFSLLTHTGIELSDHANPAVLNITVNVSDKYNYPLSLITEEKTYHLKGMKSKSLDLQKRIHKNIWLPDPFSTLKCSVHPEYIDTSMEWLAYLTIQYYMKPYFKPIDHLSIAQYEFLVTSVLEKINPIFSSYQISAISISDWPSLPDEYSSIKQTKRSPNESIRERKTISPFQSQQSLFTPQPFNPFKFNRETAKKSVINPFYRKP